MNNFFRMKRNVLNAFICGGIVSMHSLFKHVAEILNKHNIMLAASSVV